MNRTGKLLLKILGGVLVLGFVLLMIVRYNTKAHSPEDTVTYEGKDLKMEVFTIARIKRAERFSENWFPMIPFGEPVPMKPPPSRPMKIF